MNQPKPDPRHTAIVGLDLRIVALQQAIKDKRRSFAMQASEAVKVEREELSATMKARAEIMADVAQQWLPLEMAG